MHHAAEIEAWRLHREELARQVEVGRMSRRLRASRPKLGLLARFGGGSRTSGEPQATC